MRRDRRRNRRSVIITYVTRVVFCLVLVGAVFLMVCGCLYLRDFIKLKRESARTVGENVNSTLEDSSSFPVESSVEETVPETTQEVPGEYRSTVVVDAGHGGVDSGTNVTIDGKLIEEKNITLAVAEKVKALLEKEDITVVMTREGDEAVSLDERVIISGENHADLFLSIHCNSYEDDESVSGLECYYWEDDKDGMDFASSIHEQIKDIEGLRARGVRESSLESNDYMVLRENTRPAVLIEMGFITNEKDRENLLDDDYQQLLAEKFVEGIVTVLPDKQNRKDRQGIGFPFPDGSQENVAG